MPQKIIGSGQSFDSTLTVLPELQEGHFVALDSVAIVGAKVTWICDSNNAANCCMYML